MKYNLPDSIASSQDLTELILEIKNYAKWFEHESIKIHLNVKHLIKSPDLSQPASDLIHSLNQKKQINQDSLDDLIAELENYKNKSTEITVTLGSIPTSKIKKEIVAWFRKNTSKNILIDFRFTSTILGGIVLRVGSKIIDMSFRRQIIANKNMIPEAIKHV